MLKPLARVLLMFTVMTGTLFAQQPKKSQSAPTPATITDPLTPQEQAFVDLMNGVTLTGKFSMDLDPGSNPREERYQIDSVRKVQDSQWIINARMKVGEVVLPIPVPVQMVWAGDTPMLQLTDLNLPLVGSGFTARILFFENRYAGTWQHGKIGGHLWGVLAKSPRDEASDPAKPDVAPQPDGVLK